jgi:hypothetical protein
LVSLPENIDSAMLTLWLFPLSGETTSLGEPPIPTGSRLDKFTSADDAQYVLILDQADQWIDTLLWQRRDQGQWTRYQFDLIGYAGDTIKLHIGAYNNGLGGVTGMYADDVVLEVCPPP